MPNGGSATVKLFWDLWSKKQPQKVDTIDNMKPG